MFWWCCFRHPQQTPEVDQDFDALRIGASRPLLPPGSPQRARVDSTLISALARAHQWKRMLENGRHVSVSELAVAEKLDRGYLGRILMLTLLAPDIVESILDGRQPAELGVHLLRRGFQWSGESSGPAWQPDSADRIGCDGGSM